MTDRLQMESEAAGAGFKSKLPPGFKGVDFAILYELGKAALENRTLTQAELADRIGVSRATVNRRMGLQRKQNVLPYGEKARELVAYMESLFKL